MEMTMSPRLLSNYLTSAQREDEPNAQRGVVALPLSAGERATLEAAAEAAPERVTLDGWAKLAHDRGEVLFLDVERGGVRAVDPADLPASAWVS
jgi:hypothetical protein